LTPAISPANLDQQSELAVFKEATNNILLADNPWLEGASASS